MTQQEEKIVNIDKRVLRLEILIVVVLALVATGHPGVIAIAQAVLR